ncbi:MAG: peptidoglycan DD-metalloendopeptidase family protein [Proteobacteria bacterium]|nr:peptidoglycan DD-metalloendopeptidase family protein [Pseudomonadota bacterium]
MKFDLRNKPALLAIAAAVIALPAIALVAGAFNETDPVPQVSTAEAPATPPAIPALVQEPELPQPLVHTVEIENGDNLMDVLVKAGAERADAHTAIQSLKGVYDPRRDLRVGDELQITLGPVMDTATLSPAETPDYKLASLRLPVAYDREVEVERADGDDFVAREIELPLTTEFVRVSGSIDSSLFVNGRDAGIPISVLIELIRIYSFDVDFQRDIWNGDAFEIMFERQRNEDDIVVNNDDIHYAKLTLRGTDLPFYRFETSKGTIDYFNEKGESVRKALMRTPLDGARLSSRFGNRKHPILGYTRLHAGVDFAAPTGTPIYAAGDGTVEVAGTNGGYGKYIRIRHNGTYSTAYAHLNGYARGVGSGKRVRQGQVIGYVGTTGSSTGPHLHYEIHRDGKQINPLGLKLPSGEKLKGDRLVAFQSLRESVDARFASLAAPTVSATADNRLTD